jgi:kynurenine formamidase
MTVNTSDTGSAENGAGSPGGTWLMPLPWQSAGVSEVYDLAHPLEPGIPHFPGHPPFTFSLTKLHGEVPYQNGVSSSAECFTTGGHVGTHIDAFSHVSQHGAVFGGRQIYSAQSYIGGVQHGGVEELVPVIAHGYLLDLPRLVEKETEPADAITADHFERWRRSGDLDVAGAAVLVRTGWANYWSDPTRYLGHVDGTPGVDASGAEWLGDHKVTVAGSDTWAFERMPNPRLDVHVHLLVRCGIPIIECLNLESLAAAGVTRFVLIAVPLRITGATGCPIRPLAIAQRHDDTAS